MKKVISVILSFLIFISVFPLSTSANNALLNGENRPTYTTSEAYEDTSKKAVYSPLQYADFDKLSTSSPTTETYDFPYFYANKTEKTSIPPRMAEGKGYNGSYALLLGGSTSDAIKNYTVRFRLKPNVITEGTYAFSVKIKKIKGTVSDLKIGVIENSNPVYSLELKNENLVKDRYLEYSWLQNVSSAAENYWSYIEISFSTPAGGSAFYIDDLCFYNISDISKENLFVIYDDNGNPTDAAGFDNSIVWSNEEHEGQSPVLRYSYNRCATNTNHLAHLANLEKSHSGNYCLEFGFSDPEINEEGSNIPINSYIDFRLSEVGNSGGSYIIKLYVFLSGTPNKVGISTPKQPDGSETFINLKPYADKGWTEIIINYTDLDTYMTSNSHSHINIQYYDTSPDSKSGLLIDSISVIQTELGENAPNIFLYGDFETIEKDYPQIDWSADNTFWGKDALDLSFMNNLPKNVAAYGATPIKGANFFNSIYNDSTFSFFTDYFISEENLELSIYLARKFTEKNKNIWLTVEDVICNPDKTIKSNWKSLLMEYASYMQSIAGNKFQGFYFDEPSSDFSAKDFRMVSEYCRLNFRKRVLTIHKAIAVNPSSSTDLTRAILDPETHKYVTDIGYWKYNTWSNASAITLAKFKETMTSGEFDPNVRKWIVPIIGRSDPCQTEADICTLISNTVYGAMEIPGFGGVGLYALSYRIVSIKETEADQKLLSMKDQLLADGIIWERIDSNGENNYKFLEANGADLLRKDPKTGLAKWNNCLKLVEGIATDLYGNNIKNYDLINGVAVIKNEITTVNLFGITAEYPRNYYNFYRNNSRINGATLLRTGDEFRCTSPNNGGFKCVVAIENDTNCDGKFNVLDIVRAKKAAAGIVGFSDAQYAALGLDNTSDISAITILNLRNILMNDR